MINQHSYIVLMNKAGVILWGCWWRVQGSIIKMERLSRKLDSIFWKESTIILGIGLTMRIMGNFKSW